MNRKDIFMSGFKSKIGYSFTYKDLAEFEAIIDFYEKEYKKQKEVINNAIEYVEHRIVEDDYMLRVDTDMVQKELLDILKEK